MIIHFYLILKQKFVSYLIKISFLINKIFLVLLQYHAQHEMREAIQNAFMHNFQTMLNARVEPVNPLLVLHINRKSIVQDTINQVIKKKRFYIKEK